MHVTVIGLSFFVSVSTVYGNSAAYSSFVPNFDKVTDNKVVNTKVNPKTIVAIADVTNAPVEIKEDVLENDLPSLTSSFAFSDTNSIEKPVGVISKQEKGREGVISYTVEDGDTLWYVANKFGITTNTIKWSNNLADENSIKPGLVLEILPISGTLHKVSKGDNLQKIASFYGASVPQIIDENGLLNEEATEGQVLIIPGGTIREVSKPAPKPQAGPQKLAAAKNSKTASVSGKRVSYGGSGNKFPGGWCTSYVASRRSIPWRGNAGAWLGNARAMGFATGRSPQAGAIIVTTESSVGHVGLVESVNGDSVTISEMNYVGRGRISRRTISNGSGFIRGYIY